MMFSMQRVGHIVVLDFAGTAAMTATKKPENALCNFGGDFGSLKIVCLAEIGLPAPKPPVWHHVAGPAE